MSEKVFKKASDLVLCQPSEDQFAALAVCNVGRMHHHGEQEPLGIHQNMALASSQFLGPIKPAHPASQRVDRLTVNYGLAGGGISADMQPRQFAQLRMDTCPGAIETPLSEMPIDRLPRALLTGQIAPGAATPQDIKDAFDDAPNVNRPGPATRLGGRDQRLQHGPVRIIQVTGVHWDCHARDTLRKVFETRISGRYLLAAVAGFPPSKALS